MQNKINNITKTFIKIGFVAAFAFVAVATINVTVDQNFALSQTVAFADDGGGSDGGDGGGNDSGGCCGDSGFGGDSGWGGGYDAGTGSDYGNSIGSGGSDGGSSSYWTTTTYVPPVSLCPVGQTHISNGWYRGAQVSNVCVPSYCTNGALDAPGCNSCPVGQVLSGPLGSQSCVSNVCSNGATNAPYCNICPAGKILVNNICTTINTSITADITTSPKSINSGSSSLVSWTSTNATYCVLNGGQFNNQTVGVSGSYTVFPTANVNYTITCYNASGMTATDSDYVAVNAVVNNPTATISANPSTITNGGSTILTWSSTNATYCVLNGGQFSNFRVAVSGSVSANPTTGTNYTITCYNDAGASATSNTYVNVNTASCTNGATNAPYCNVCPAGQTLINNVCTTIVNSITADINVNPSSVTSGSTATLSWTSTNATYCVLNGGNYNNTQVAASGSYTIYPTAHTNYTIQCYNNAGQYATDNAYVSVTTASNLPTVTLYPSQYSINQNGQVTLYWSSNNAAYCTANTWPFSGSKNISGSENVTLSNTTTFYITCFNAQGQSAQAQTTVTVNANNYVYCNGVQYPAGTVCPNTNTVGVSTTGANPLQTSATIYGYVNPNGTSATAWFEYGTNPNSLIYSTTRQNAYTTGQMNAGLTGLACGTTYYYRAVAQNAAGVKYGSVQSFVTSACTNNQYVDNTIITRPATLVSSYQGQLNGAFVAGNTANNCSVYFEYGTTTGLGQRTSSQGLYTTSGVNYFSSALSTLYPGTRYYYRAVSNCNGALSYGNVLSFTTPAKSVKYTYISKPVTKVVTSPVVCNCDTNNVSNTGVTTAAEYMDLVVERLESGATIGGNANYRVIYKNISSTTLQDVAVRVILPEELSIVSADAGEYQAGGSSIVLSLSMLRALEEGRINLTTAVKSGLTPGKQIVVNAYSNYSVPNIVRNGSMFQDEVTAYVLSTLTSASSVSNVNAGSVTTAAGSGLFGGNFIEWIILIALVLLFLLALSYIFGASKRRNNN